MDRRATRPTWSDNLAHAEMMQARKWVSQIPRPAQYYGIDLRRSETGRNSSILRRAGAPRIIAEATRRGQWEGRPPPVPPRPPTFRQRGSPPRAVLPPRAHGRCIGTSRRWAERGSRGPLPAAPGCPLVFLRTNRYPKLRTEVRRARLSEACKGRPALGTEAS